MHRSRSRFYTVCVCVCVYVYAMYDLYFPLCVCFFHVCVCRQEKTERLITCTQQSYMRKMITMNLSSSRAQHNSLQTR